MALKIYNEKGALNLEMLDSEAKNLAKSFIRPPRVKAGRHNIPDKKLTTTELREFFIEMQAIYDYYRANHSNEKAFDDIQAQLLLIKARAMYSCPRTVKNRRIPGTFRDFLIDLVDVVKNGDDLKNSMMIFEAVIGYCYGMGIRD
ncbi:MAG: type III-A CRISPR-associated protein Csm2 [Candidatus Zixiibacteriota bacterium]